MRKLLASLLLLLTLSAANAQCIGSLPVNLTNGTLADASQVMQDFNFIVSQTNANCATAGANSNITALTGLTTPLTPGQGGSQVYTAGTSTGSANAQVVSSTITPANFSLVGKNIACFVAGFTNTGATTLNYNATGATNIFKRSTSGPIALSGGEIVTNNLVCAQYDGTQYQLINDNKNELGKQVSLASATTTDLGTSATHNILITGTTTITAFGSSAQTDLPLYFIQFNGALTLTHNATSLILPGATNITTASGDYAFAQYLGSGNWRVSSYQRAASIPYSSTAYTVQTFTTGTAQTYTLPAGVVRIRVTMVGAGGGGGASNTNNGSNGSANTSFQGSAGGFTAWTAVLGQGGTAGGNGVGGSGGTGGVDGTGTRINREPGADGWSQYTQETNVGGSGAGAPSAFGGGGRPVQSHSANTAGVSAVVHGSGGSGATNSSSGGGGGGGAGEYVQFWVTAAQLGATATYTVGTGGNGGSAGGAAGGNGANGKIIVEELYN